jgi:hypothetical protein
MPAKAGIHALPAKPQPATRRKHFFFVNKKEAKKTLIPLDRAGFRASGPVKQKFFASRPARLFFKKEALALLSSTPS